ncbi:MULTISPECIES: CBS and ACT domain-containing protein [unclassified Granulicatella]|uniref:CBS and ACT domain-containing protein n=1 Tax=unclassified Granulicatella TaxID=2630493 RepID=UPI001073DC37|nr:MULTISPECIES: CBS and ACT domain-containing protein [unclassified Granulicatella]MBF0779631.1 CBS domain-containing protein [Granulicatella sp. 19428wC4_WM01]TFU96289.1 CBS domain-containing protein [Granulicatella sp. WM01]
MDVRRYMTTEIISVTGDVRVLEALDVMKAHSVKRLPVVKGSRIVGLVTDKLIAEHMPSQATSLSMHELNYLLTKTRIEDIMETKVVTIHPDALLEEAAVIMREKRIGVLPVVENNQLVGLITSSDIFDAFVDVLGYYKPGVRLVIEIEDRAGIFEQVLALFRQENINIEQIAVYHENNQAQVVIQLDSQDAEHIHTLVEHAGYKVLSSLLKNGK